MLDFEDKMMSVYHAVGLPVEDVLGELQRCDLVGNFSFSHSYKYTSKCIDNNIKRMIFYSWGDKKWK